MPANSFDNTFVLKNVLTYKGLSFLGYLASYISPIFANNSKDAQTIKAVAFARRTKQTAAQTKKHILLITLWIY
jgi:hypothetical protein